MSKKNQKVNKSVEMTKKNLKKFNGKVEKFRKWVDQEYGN